MDRRRLRRWTFADCVFDEADWTLTVAGRRVAIEVKPLELLRELLQRAGKLVPKDELMRAIWPDVAVVEASLPTAVRKLRTALDDDRREPPIIETVPKFGYRLAAPVAVEDLPGDPDSSATTSPVDGARVDDPAGTAFAASFRLGPAIDMARPVAIVTGLALALAIALYAINPPRVTATKTPFSQWEAATALRKLDVGAVEQMLAAGWDPNIPFDSQGNGAVNLVLNICEWDRRHDQSQLLLMVRTLIDGGARLDHRNSWGDTPYSIAKAIRYCGPNHPVTQSIRTMCYAGHKPLGDRCLASYEIARRTGN